MSIERNKIRAQLGKHECYRCKNIQSTLKSAGFDSVGGLVEKFNLARSILPMDHEPGLPDVYVTQERYDKLKAEIARLREQLRQSNGYLIDEMQKRKLSDHAASRLREQLAGVAATLRRLRPAISDYGGHGNPGCPDRVEGLLAMKQADEALRAHQESKG